MRPFNPLTRRAVIAGTGPAATLALLGVPARAQTDGFRTIRARDTGYDGAVPGPVLRVKRGEELKVRLVNELATETAIHWHGVRVPNAMDGTSLTQKPVAPGASFDYRFTPPDAGTFWYRPPIRTPQNRALHGLLIVDEAQPAEVDRDVALILDASSSQFTANGLTGLDIPVTANERVRLRLINAADRFITLRIDRHPMTVMAIDGQPAEPFVARDSRITLSPGNRADLFFDAVLEPGTVAPIVVQDDGADVAARAPRLRPRAQRKRGPSRAAPRRPCRRTPCPSGSNCAARGVSTSRSTQSPASCRRGRTSPCSAAAPSCWRSRTGRRRRRCCTSTAITCACSMRSTTDGSRSGSTRSCAFRSRRRASRSWRTIRASGCCTRARSAPTARH